MEMIKIDHLPVEILMKIFSYLPSYSDVSLVNKLFYNVTCSVNSNVPVLFDSIFLKSKNHQSVMDSIQSTQRKVSKLVINFRIYDWTLQELAISHTIKIVNKFSATIKYFHFENIWLEMGDFLEILSLLPNAEHLVFDDLCGIDKSETVYELTNECLNLHRLKTLELRRCSQKFPVVFNRLPAGVLKKLTIAYWNLNLNLLTGLFAQQSNIIELVLLDEAYDYDGSKSTLPDHIFDHLKLESFKFFKKTEYNSEHAKMLSKQTELMSLSLRGGEADEGILNVITNHLSELKILEINVSEAMVVPFKRIVKLRKLKELTLESCSLKLIETFAGLDNSRITSLTMNKICIRSMDDINNDVFPPMPINVIGALANSVPNLKVLHFDYYCECEASIAIMQQFNFIEVLKVKFDVAANRLTKEIEVGLCFNAKLTELIIANKFVCEEPLLRKLIAVYPNLKKLHLSLSTFTTFITTSQFMVILNGFKKMESLELNAYSVKLTTEYLDIIKVHKNNLKSITLGHFDFDELPAEQKKKLSTVFDVIKYKYGTLRLGYKTIVKST